MRYLSTRGLAPEVSFSDAALAGLAPDGGLYVPQEIPLLELDRLPGLSYRQVAEQVMAPFCDDLAPEVLQGLLAQAYRGEFDPAARLNGSTLELFHGPTLSFKDVALQFLGPLLDHVLTRRDSYLNLLVATSGDTGSAALAAAAGRDRLRCCVMFPKGRVSRLQQLQMTTEPGENLSCLAVRGTFDDCQAILKTLSNDSELKASLHLGAVNSVNWARLLAQSVPYVWLWSVLRRPLRLAIPTGNFGHVLSAWLAARMGVPIERLIIATNENDVVHRFFASGSYARGPFLQTLAPAMDIGVASNLERWLYWGGGSEAVRGWMQCFEQSGRVEIGSLQLPGPEVVSGSASGDDILRAIREAHAQTGQVLCPHTAVAWHVARALGEPQAIVVATAHPAKFPEAVGQALGTEPPTHPALQQLLGKPERVSSIDPTAQAVRDSLLQRWGRGGPAERGAEA